LQHDCGYSEPKSNFKELPMSFLSRLFGTAPEPEGEGDGASPRTTEESVNPSRKSGTDRPPTSEAASLAFGEPLLRLAFDAGPSQRVAQKRLAELIDAKTISIGQLPQEAPDHRATLLAIAALTADPANFDAAAQDIVEPAAWVELATSGPSAKVRQMAASRVESPDQLRAVMKAARDSDKNVYRIAKTKLDAINAAAKRVEEQRAHMHSVAETIERHSYKPFDGAYVATVDHLAAEWQAMDVEIPPELCARVEAAIDRSREVISSHIQAAGARAAHESAVANATPIRLSTIDELKRILNALYAVTTFDAAAAASVNDRLEKLAERWQHTVQYKPASRDETAEFAALRGAVHRLAQSMAASGTVQQQLEKVRDEPSSQAYSQLNALIADRSLLAADDVPAVVTLVTASTMQWREEQAAQRAAAEDAERQLAQLVRKAQHALQAGRSRQALGMRRSIEAKAKHFPTVPKHIAERLQQLDEKLQELQDWKSFAVTPKRSELIAQMQALIGVDEEPTQLAEEIKRLQEEWKELAKGSSDSEEDWAKFHEAAQAAYQPCKTYFEAQSKLRERNLEQRKALVKRLAEYEQTTDWDQVEWKNVVNALRSAKQEWRTASPTERGATKPVEKHFDELIGRIQARLDAEYTANVERKQSLVAQAQKLVAIEDLAQASNDVKRLQSAWRNVGITPHAEGQRLWEEFKQHCDAVFDKRRQEHTERMAELEQNEERALALCIEAEGLAQRSGAELFAAAARTRELHDSFAAIGELPRDKAQEIQRRFRRGLDQFEHAIKQQRLREADQAWDNFFDASNRVRLRQLAADESVDVELSQFIVAIEHWPKGGKHAIEQKLARKAGGDLAENEAALRALAIKAEIATGTTTPEADQSQRRTMQLQALVKGIGRATTSVREQLETLAFEWVSVGPVATANYDELFARFKRAWSASRR
jgi:DNA repair protein SbcC/Rad50